MKRIFHATVHHYDSEQPPQRAEITLTGRDMRSIARAAQVAATPGSHILEVQVLPERLSQDIVRLLSLEAEPHDCPVEDLVIVVDCYEEFYLRGHYAESGALFETARLPLEVLELVAA